MLRNLALAVTATLVLAGGIFGFQGVASAGPLDDPDHWAYDAADWVQNECHDIPTSLLGAASGVVAPLGLTQQGPEAVSRAGAPPTTITVRDLAPGAWDDEWYRKKLNNQELRLWLERGAIAPDDPKPRLPISTIGGSGSPTIETTGTVKVGTDNSKAVVTPLRVAGTGVSAISGSSVALSAAVFGGAMCGTINALGAVFGDPWETASRSLTYSGPVVELPVSERGPCSGMTGAPSGTPFGSYCMRVTPPAPANRIAVRIIYENTPGSLTEGGSSILPVGGSGTWLTVTADTERVIALPCLGPENYCGHFPPGVNNANAANAGSWGTHLAAMTSGGSIVAVAPINPDWLDDGLRRRLRAQVECKLPHTTTTQNLEGFSGVFNDRQAAPNWPSVSCPNGWAPTKVLLTRQTARFGGSSALVWEQSDVSLDWQISAAANGNGPTLACFAVGATSCPTPDDPTDSTKRLIGGPGGVSVPKTEPTARDVVAEVIDAMDLTDDPLDSGREEEEDPDPDPDPGSTSGADPRSGGTPGTTTDPTGASCWPGGWGWLNPVEWVLNPIKCALVWAFWDQDAADEIAELTSDTGWPDLVSESSLDTSTATGPCIPIDEAEICTQPILEIEAPGYVQVLIAALVAFFVVFEVVGLFSRITDG